MQSILDTGKITIIADTREFQSNVVKELARKDCIVAPKQLHVADYICSERVGIERKSVSDFLQSIIDQRLFEQAKALKEAYPNCAIIVEGNIEDLFTTRNIHPNAINGALSSIAIDYRIPIIWSMAESHTASLLYTIAKREQMAEEKAVAIRGDKRVMSYGDQQKFLVAGLPNVSTVLAERLLGKFGTPKKVFSASEEKLKKVEGIGEKKAKSIWGILNKKY